MNDALKDLLQRVKADPKVLQYDEAKAKQGIILPALDSVGWNTFDVDQVTPELPVEKGNVDYALKIEGKPKVFIEAKKPDLELKSHQEQLLNYAFRTGVPLAILTNGILWWFYLSSKEVDWSKRKFCEIDINKDKLETVAEKIEKLLSQENIRSGYSIDYANQLYQDRGNEREIEDRFPDAWNKVISEPHPSLLSLLSEATETLCRRKPSEDEIKKCLEKHKTQLLISQTTKLPKPPDETSPNLFDPLTPNKEILIIRNIIKRKELWARFIQKKELTKQDFKALSDFKPITIGAFTRFLIHYKLARPTRGNTFTIQEPYISVIETLLSKGIKGIKKERREPPIFEEIPPDQIQRHILDRVKLWEVFLEQRKMTSKEFKQHSKFKPKSIAGFFNFLNKGIAERTGNTFELVSQVIPKIKKLLKTSD